MSRAKTNCLNCIPPRCGWARKPKRWRFKARSPKSKARTPHEFCASIFSFAAVAPAAAGMAEGAARIAAGVCLFVGAARARDAEHHAFASWRIFDVAAVAGAGALHCSAGAAASDEERDDGEGQRRGHRRGTEI